MMKNELKSILVVEDDNMLRQAMSEALQAEGYSVVAVADGQAALDWLSAVGVNPQVIITDLIMPRMNGWELWDRLRAKKQWKTIPVFVLSSATHEKEWPDAAAPTQQIKKPPDFNRLLHLLDTLPMDSHKPASLDRKSRAVETTKPRSSAQPSSTRGWRQPTDAPADG